MAIEKIINIPSYEAELLYKISFILEKAGLKTENIFFASYPNILVFFMEKLNIPLSKSVSQYAEDFEFVRRRVIFEKNTDNVPLSSKLNLISRAFSTQTYSLKHPKQKSDYIDDFICFLRKKQKENYYIFLYVDFDFFEELERGYVRMIRFNIDEMLKNL